MQELEKKLGIEERAVNAKDEEVQATCVELEQCMRQAALELQEAWKISEELKGTLEQEAEQRWSEDTRRWKRRTQKLEEELYYRSITMVS